MTPLPPGTVWIFSDGVYHCIVPMRRAERFISTACHQAQNLRGVWVLVLDPSDLRQSRAVCPSCGRWWTDRMRNTDACGDG